MAEAEIHHIKACTKCGAEKSATLAFFSSAKLGRDGLKAQCKECCAAYLREWQRGDYKRNPTRRLDANRRCRQANLEKYRERDRGRSKRRGSRADAHRDWSERNRQRVRACKAAAERKRRAIKLGCGGAHSPKDVEVLLFKQGYRCFYCSAMLSRYDVDHFIPLAKSGTNDISNLRISCPSCNRSKGAKLPWEWKPDMFKEKFFGQSA